MSSKVTGWALASLAAVPLLVTPGIAQTTASKQAAISCPERLRTMAATPGNPAQVSGFEMVIGGPTSSQSFLQDIEIRAGSKVLKGRADGKKKVTWTFDGTTDVALSCLYEGGVSLTRSAGRPKSCAATLKRSKDYPGKANGWGMDSASLRCR